MPPRWALSWMNDDLINAWDQGIGKDIFWYGSDGDRDTGVYADKGDWYAEIRLHTDERSLKYHQIGRDRYQSISAKVEYEELSLYHEYELNKSDDRVRENIARMRQIIDSGKVDDAMIDKLNEEIEHHQTYLEDDSHMHYKKYSIKVYNVHVHYKNNNLDPIKELWSTFPKSNTLHVETGLWKDDIPNYGASLIKYVRNIIDFIELFV